MSRPDKGSLDISASDDLSKSLSPQFWVLDPTIFSFCGHLPVDSSPEKQAHGQPSVCLSVRSSTLGLEKSVSRGARAPSTSGWVTSVVHPKPGPLVGRPREGASLSGRRGVPGPCGPAHSERGAWHLLRARQVSRPLPLFSPSSSARPPPRPAHFSPTSASRELRRKAGQPSLLSLGVTGTSPFPTQSVASLCHRSTLEERSLLFSSSSVRSDRHPASSQDRPSSVQFSSVSQ